MEHLYIFDWYAPHQAWLKEKGYYTNHDSKGAKPKRANLSYANLYKANLSYANLPYANLTN